MKRLSKYIGGEWLLWGSLSIIAFLYVYYILGAAIHPVLGRLSLEINSLVNQMWWGLLLATFFIGILNKIPRAAVMAFLGTKKSGGGLIRAIIAGLFLDLCSHGILIVGMKFYERGASLGQTIAFLLASPWNSLSLTIILVSLIGLMKTLIIIAFSCVIALISGLFFNYLVQRKILPQNKNSFSPELDSDTTPSFSAVILESINPKNLKSVLLDGIKGSRPILKWVFFGIVTTVFIRVFLSEEYFTRFFGPHILGLGSTLLSASVLEVCSEGSSPIAADLINRAGAFGNGFVFLMAGVSTDYTEILSLREVTKSWKIALFLPLISIPQILLVGYILNFF